MASPFDQYEQASLRPKILPNADIRPEASTTGFIHMKLEEEEPIFQRQKVKLTPPDRITCLAVCNDFLVLSVQSLKLIRVDLQAPEKLEEIDISKSLGSSVRLTGLFLSPNGEHLLLATSRRSQDVQSQVFYLNRRSSKVKPLNKMKGHDITAVAWSFQSQVTDPSTAPLLLGTSKGIIFESELKPDVIFGNSVEQYWKQVFDVGREKPTPITGLEYHRLPEDNRYFIIVSTNVRLYEYIGKVTNRDERPMMQQIFNNYLNKNSEKFYVYPKEPKHTRLQFFYPSPAQSPTELAWLVREGLSFRQVDFKSKTNEVLGAEELLTLPSPPISFVMTEFHVLLLYRDRIKGVSKLSREVVFEEEGIGTMINITKDPLKDTIWAFSTDAVYKYKVTDEDRNVWQVYVEKEDFELAKKYCKNNPLFLDQVLVRQAEKFFAQKEYVKSAIHYADTQFSFEEVSLKFIQANQTIALRVFLEKKLSLLKPSEQAQNTMIVIWLLEIFLNQLGQLRDTGKEATQEYSSLLAEMDEFLKRPAVMKCIEDHRETVYELISSHGDTDTYVRLASLNKDYEKVIRLHLCRGKHLEALNVLRDHGTRDLFYKFSPALMQAAPRKMVEVLKMQGKNLNPSKLLPTLISCNLSDKEAVKEAISYLEFCIRTLGCQDRALHNYLVSLYVREDKERLMTYLNSQGQDVGAVAYDPHFVLRLCREHKVTQACVQMCALVSQWEAAVHLALTINVDLAKQIALQPQDDADLQRKLWLKIAKHVVSEKNDIKKALEFLHQCPQVKIEDILPFFSDFVTIDNFKDAICTSLQEYNHHIKDLKDEMEEATKSAELIRKEVQSFRNRYSEVLTTDTCSECELQLLLRPFYLFPCGHRFHADCLLAAVTPLLPAGRRGKLHDLQRQLTSLTAREDSASIGSATLSARDQVKADVDAIVASECLYCGELMIQSIHQPFVKDEDYEQIMKEWK